MIKEISLVNIKSYQNQVIPFYEGVNAIIGENGAGKSTILEAIGFALFDYLPYKISDFIRKGERRGEIRVKIVGKDERLYEVVRKITPNGTSEYYIRDLETLTIIEEGVNGITNWVKENFDIEIDPRIIFENAIGVPQGKIVSQFLEKPSVRDKIFSPILGVESYKKAYEKSREYEKFIKSKIDEIEKQIISIKKEVELGKKFEKELKNLEESKKSKVMQIEKVKKELESLKKQQSTFDEIYNKINELEKSKYELKTELASIDSKIKIFKLELDKIKKAEIEQKGIESEYIEYLKAEKKLSELQRIYSDLESKINKLLKLKTGYEIIKTKISNLKQKLEDLKSKESLLSEYKKLAEKERYLKEKVREIEAAEANLKSFISQKDSLEKEIERDKCYMNEILKKEEKLKKLEEKLSKAKKIEDQRDKIVKKITELETKIKIDEKQYLRIKDGICPILNEKCQRLIEVSKTKASEIEKNKALLDSLLKKYEKIEDIYEKIKELRKKAETLRGEVKVKERIQNEIREKEKLKNNLEAKINELRSILKHKDDILEEYKKVEGYNERVNLILEELAEKNKIENELNKYIKIAEKIRPKLSMLPDLQERFNKVKTEVTNLRKILEKNREFFERYVSLNQIIKRKSEIIRKINELTAERNKVDAKLNKVEKELGKLINKYDLDVHRKINSRIQELIEIKSRLEGEIDQITKRLNEIKSELTNLKEKENILKEMEKRKKIAEKKYKFIKDLREIFKIAIPKIIKAFTEAVSVEANRIFCEIMDDYGWEIKWTEDFGIKAKYLGKEINFAQMSGGEQVCAALAVRLSLLKLLSGLGIVFFDEPTQNMDETRRRNFASQLTKISGFKQIFIISHDDTFEEMVESAVKIKKIDGVSVAEL